MAEQNRFLDLSDYWRMVRQRIAWPILCAVLVAGLAAAYVVTREPMYLARAKVQVLPLVDPIFGSATGLPDQLFEPDLETEAEIVQSVSVAEKVAGDLDVSPYQLVKGVQVEVVDESSVMYIGYLDRDPDTAATLANRFAEEYIVSRVEGPRGTVDDVIADVEEKIAELETDLELAETDGERFIIASRIERAEDQLSELQRAKAAIQGGRIVQRAVPPLSPTGIGLVPVVIIGGMLGALLGSAIAIGQGLLDDRIGGRRELSEQVGAPVLGVIPSVESWHDRDRAELVLESEPTGPAAEAYRTLATNVRFLRSQRSLNLVVITSALPAEGKSATAANLAWALTETGLRVILVDADMRRPRADRFFQLTAGRAGLREAIEGADVQSLLVDTDLEGLSILPSGSVPPDPVAHLSQASSVLAELRLLADVVIADSPPVLPVADASILAEHADGVVLVHDPGVSRKTELVEAVGQLRTAGGIIVGGTYNNISQSQRAVLGFSRYDTYYGAGERPDSRRSRKARRRERAAAERAPRRVPSPAGQPIDAPSESATSDRGAKAEVPGRSTDA